MKRNEFIWERIIAKIFSKEIEFLMERLIGRANVICSVNKSFDGVNLENGWTKAKEISS